MIIYIYIYIYYIYGRKDIPSVFIGLGSIYAMRRDYDKAIQAFSLAIEIVPNIAEAYKRRGQTKAAKGLIKSALKDLTKTISLKDEADSYYQRGLLYHQIRNYTRSLSDFQKARQQGS